MQSDLNVYILENEILLDFEPGYGATVVHRLEKYVIADDVQVADVAQLYGLLSVQGPKADEVVRQAQLGVEPPKKLMSLVSRNDSTLGEIYLMNLPRTGSGGFDLFVPMAALIAAMDKLVLAAKAVGGRACGWQALESARIEAGIPRYGADIDETNLASEASIEERAISYSKGCYIGQEVIARIRTYGQVAKALRGLRLADDLKKLPVRGDRLFQDGKEVGYVTSAVCSPRFKANLALGYVRREYNQPGQTLDLGSAGGLSKVEVVKLPFRNE
jgi:folate-binding protein YgfZ